MNPEIIRSQYNISYKETLCPEKLLTGGHGTKQPFGGRVGIRRSPVGAQFNKFKIQL